MKKVLVVLFCLIFVCPAFADYRPGFCPLTGNRIISQQGRALPNYAIAWFELDNENRMPVAVDKSVVNHITESNFDTIMQHVIEGWKWEISRKKWSPKQIQNYADAFYNRTIKKVIE